MVADALSWKVVENLIMMITTQVPLFEEMRCFGLEVVSLGVSMRFMSMVLQPALLKKI